MKQFKCGDVVPGCQWVTRSDDENELFEQIHSHARDTHGMDEVPPEVVDAIQAVITDVYPDGETANAPDSKNASSDSAYGASSSP